MKPTRLLSIPRLLAGLFVSGALVAAAVTPPAAADGFTEALAQVDAAQLEFQNGRAEPFKALWSNADDVTLAGGFGGAVEKGWPAVSRRLDWAAAQFSNGTHETTRLVAASSGDLGYVVQHERIRFTPPGSTEPTIRELRATMVLRREPAGWRIVHRHADAQLTRAAPR